MQAIVHTTSSRGVLTTYVGKVWDIEARDDFEFSM
jgi:hypothetical protein